LKKLAINRPDPRLRGAKCDECPLNKQLPTQPELRKSKLLILGEAPGDTETITGLPFQGRSGTLLDEMLQDLGSSRQYPSISNAVLCAPLSAKMDTKDWHKAVECCAPRLAADIADSEPTACLALGNWALYAMTSKQGIDNWRGAPLDGKLPTLATFHPAFVLRAPTYRATLKLDIKRAIDLAEGAFDFDWGEMVIDESNVLDALLRLRQSGKPIAIDVENTGDPFFGATLLSVAVSNEDLGASFMWPPTEKIAFAFQELMVSDLVKVFHFGQHDRLVLKYQGFPVAPPYFDTLLAHAAIAPQSDHNLSFVTANELRADRWKTVFRAAKVDKTTKVIAHFGKMAREQPVKFLTYNCKDAKATALIKPRLEWRLDNQTHRGREHYETYTKLDEIAIKMRERGIAISRDALEVHRKKYKDILKETQAAFTAAVPDPAFKLGESGASPTLSKLFFERLGVRPRTYTEKTGAPQLDAEMLESMLADPNPYIKKVSKLVLDFRKATKIVGNYIDGIPITEQGNVHPTWNVTGVRTGRWSANDPAVQTIPKPLRSIFAPRAGNYIISADYMALELRILGYIAEDEILIEWFAQGRDVHAQNAELIFGPAWRMGDEKTRKKLRNVAKGVIFGLSYGGGADTIWRVLLARGFTDVTLEMVQTVIDGWFKHHPKIATWRDNCLSTAAATGYVESAVSNRRLTFHDGKVNPTAAVNHPVQATAGDICNIAIIEVDKQLNWQDEGILFQVHDDITCEGPDPKRIGGILKSCMEHEVVLAGVKRKFPVDLSYGSDWFNLKPLEL
jgi:DNA polymerase-1